MPQKDAVVKEEIQEANGTSRLGREKIIVKVQKKHPHLGAFKIRRVYQKEGFFLFKRIAKKLMNNPVNPIEVPSGPNVKWARDLFQTLLRMGENSGQ